MACKVWRFAMEKTAILERLKESIVSFDIEAVRRECQNALDKGIAAYDIVTNGMAKGMEIVGQKYEKGEFFLSELIMAAEAMKGGMKVVEPALEAGGKASGKVVIGTVKGDIHDIGKNITISLLRSSGFGVVDLGVDVPAEKFVEEVRASKPNILGLSALITTTMTEMPLVLEKLRKARQRDKIKVIIGGAPVTPQYARKIGADAGTTDAIEGVKMCQAWARAL